jgi:hypothetical protein
VKSEYTAKLYDATEKYRVTLTENEELKEKVEIPFKLGRSYIDKGEPAKSDRGDAQDNIQQRTTTDNDESKKPELDADQDENNIGAWATNKYRGFRRVSPTTNAQPGKPTPHPPTGAPSASRSPPASKASSTSSGTTSVNERLQNLAMNDSPTSAHNEGRSGVSSPYGRAQYCHYFTNFGKCFFEEKYGTKCRFEHKVAPMCQSGTACNRPKCMFTHPNMGGRNNTSSFLGNNSGFQSNPGFQNNMNPWQQMTSTFMNPWNYMAMPPFQQPTVAPFQHQQMGRENNN